MEAQIRNEESVGNSSSLTLAERRSHAAPQPRRPRWRRGDTIAGYLFIAPAILGFTVLVAYPLIFASYYAFTNYNGLTDPKFIGLENFRYMFTRDPAFWPSLKATAIYGLLNVPASLVAGLLLAMLLNRQLRGVQAFRTIVYLPVVLPAVAVLTLWKYIYDPLYGLANQALTALHLPTSLWLGSEQMVLPAFVLINIWGIGGTTLIFLAGLQAIPADLYDAAKIDGAGVWSLFRRITLPMVSPILFLQLILQLNAAFQNFGQPKLLTGGGPGFASDIFMFKIYTDGFTGSAFPQVGYATAEVWVLFFIILAITALTFRASSMWVYAESAE